MLVVGFPVGMLQANCYLLATEAGQPCVIVDPGQDAVEPIDEALREHSLSPAAVLLTHGHYDHITDVPYVAAATGATVLGTETHLNLLRALRTPDGTQAAPDQLSTVCGGELIQFPGCTVRVLRSLHSALGPRRTVPYPGTRPGAPPPAVRTISDHACRGASAARPRTAPAS